jgi:hypothetical protein
MKMKARKEMLKPYYFLIAFSCIIVLMFIVIAPANAGVSPDKGRSIGNATNGTLAFIGEINLTFVDTNGTLIPEGYLTSDWPDSNIDILFPNNGSTFDSKLADSLRPGRYKVTDLVGVEKTPRIVFKSKYDLTIVDPKRGEKVTKGDNITFEASTDLNWIKGLLSNYIKYKLIGPSCPSPGCINVSGVSLININVNETGNNLTTINTATLEMGTYTLSIETDPATNNGLDEEGPSVSFTVEARGITIKAEPTEEVVNEDITFTVSTSPNTNIILNETSGRASKVKFRRDIFGVDVPVDRHSASGRSDKDGNFTAVAYFTDTGSYTITAKERAADTEASVTVRIVEFSALVSTDKSKYYIGESVEIKGSANAGDNVTIKIDDKEIKIGESLAGGKFSYNWATTEEDVSPGSYELGIWVLPLSNPFTDPPDDSVSILFIRGGLSAKLIYTGIEEEKEIVQEIVAQGDDFEIKGTAPGRDNVDILTIAPKGGSGSGFAPTDIFKEIDLDVPGLTYSTSSVSDGAFTKTIDVGKDVDTGTYLIAVLNPGRDEVYGSTNSSEILTVLSNYNPSIKTQAQILAILKAETINVAGSDDLLWVGTIEVENPWVTLNDIEDVHLGDEIEVSGVTNRKNGFLFIITVEGPTELTPLFAPTEVSTTGGTFTASFNTISAKVGKYTVTVNDGDGYTDTKTVNILPATTPSFNISSMPTPTPIPAAIMHEGEGTNESDTAAQAATPIPTRTPTSTKTEEKKKSDFVLIFIIAAAGAGLLMAVSIARLVIVKRRKEGEEEEEEKQGEDDTV